MARRQASHRFTAETNGDVVNLEGLLTGLLRAGGDSEQVSFADIRMHLGQRAFGPILALAALPSLTPIATIPLLPSAMSVIILLTAGQMLAGMRQVWLPRRLLDRSLNRHQLGRMIAYALPAARLLDRLVRPRLVVLTRGPALYVLSAVCLLLALLKPPLELVPFTGGIPALPILLFGVAMMARDGLLALLTLILVIAGAAGLALAATLLL